MTQGRGLVALFCLTLVLQDNLVMVAPSQFMPMGSLNLDGLKEALMSILLEIRVDNSTLWTNSTLLAPHTNLTSSEIERALALSISHIFQRINETGPWGPTPDDLNQYIHTNMETIRLEDIEDERQREEDDYENGDMEMYVMTDPNTTLNKLPHNPFNDSPLNKRPPPTHTQSHLMLWD